MLLSIRYDVKGRLISAARVDQRLHPATSLRHPTPDGTTHTAWHGPEAIYRVQDDRLAHRLLELQDTPRMLNTLQKDWANYCQEQSLPRVVLRPPGRKPGSKIVIPRAA